MRCLDLLRSVRLPGGKPLVVALVGGGGKTSLLFALAGEARADGLSVLVTTTTRIFDPRDEGRAFDAFNLDAAWSAPASNGAALPSAVPDARWGAPPHGFTAVAGAGVEAGKLLSVDPLLVDRATGWDLIIVEADGARRLPLKAPAAHEPVIPASARVVIAVVGLDCLGRPLDDGIAFRPELVARATGLEPGGIIGPRHIAALAAAEAGCFKGAPTGALRVLVLNKLDVADRSAAGETAAAVMGRSAADLVALASLRGGPVSGVPDEWPGGPRDGGIVAVLERSRPR